jgi:hypothetical protein
LSSVVKNLQSRIQEYQAKTLTLKDTLMHKKGEIRRLKRIKNYSYAAPQAKPSSPDRAKTTSKKPVSRPSSRPASKPRLTSAVKPNLGGRLLSEAGRAKLHRPALSMPKNRDKTTQTPHSNLFTQRTRLFLNNKHSELIKNENLGVSNHLQGEIDQ